MLKDVADSKRLNTNILEKKEKEKKDKESETTEETEKQETPTEVHLSAYISFYKRYLKKLYYKPD